MRYPVILLTYLALAAIPASASRPLVTQYVAPYTNQTWEARVLDGGYGTGAGIAFTNHVTDASGEHHNFAIEIDGEWYTAWRKWWSFGSLWDGLPATMTRSVIALGSPSKRYLYWQNPDPDYIRVDDIWQDDIWKYINEVDPNPTIDDSFIIWMANNGKDGNGYSFDSTDLSAVYVQGVHTDMEYTVTFYANNGTGAKAEQIYTNSTTLASNQFVYIGHTFSGWSYGSTTYEDGELISGLDLDLLAKWQTDTYSISVDKDGGDGSVSGAGSYEYGATATIIATPNKGVHFVRWKDTAGTTITTDNSHSFTVIGAVTNIAEFAVNTYTIAYDANGNGDVEGKVAAQAGVEYGDSIKLQVCNFTRYGYSFSGWSRTQGNNANYAADQFVNVSELVRDLSHGQTLTLYAAWSPVQYTVTFHDGSGLNTKEYIDYGEEYYDITTKLPTKVGYSFLGYYDSTGNLWFRSDGTPNRAWNGTVDNLYAHWAPIGYYVAFDKNADDASGYMDTMTLSYDEPTNLTVTAFSRNKWLFDGWTNTEAQVRYEDGSIVSNLTVEANSTVTLHALWRRDTFNLALHNGDATSYLFVTNGFEYGSLPIPTNAIPAEFAGWWTSEDLSNARQAFNSTLVDKSMATNLYARWKPIVNHENCTVSFSADGAISKPEAITLVAGAEFGTLPIASYEGGYELLGWYLDGKRVTPETIVPSNVTLVARKTLKVFNDTWGCNDIAFSTNGIAGWSIDGSTKIAQSGKLPEGITGQKSILEFIPETDGSISFDWYAACRPSSGLYQWAYLQFTGSGDSIDRIAGSTEYGTTTEFHITGGEAYSFDYCRDDEKTPQDGDDCGRVKNFAWRPVSASSVVGGWASLTSITSAVPEATFASGGNASWQIVGDGDNVVAVTNLEDNGVAWLELSLPGPGEISFDWRVSSEPRFIDTNGVEHICDSLEFLVDGTCVRGIYGLDVVDYSSVVFTNEASGVHKYRWRYVKDDSHKAGEDSAYLKNLIWTPFKPATTEVEYDNPSGGDKKVVSVPNSWVDKYSLLSVANKTSYGEALMAYSGKKSPSGADLPFWYDYVAGTNPTNSASLFKIKSVSVSGDAVSIEWEPDWSDSSGEIQRVYTIWGKTNLTDAAWYTPTNSASRFFRVEVSLPE